MSSWPERRIVYQIYLFFWRESKKRAVDSVFLERREDWGRESYRLPYNRHSSQRVGQKKLIPKLGKHHISPQEIRTQFTNIATSYTSYFHLYQSICCGKYDHNSYRPLILDMELYAFRSDMGKWRLWQQNLLIFLPIYCFNIWTLFRLIWVLWGTIEWHTGGMRMVE